MSGLPALNKEDQAEFGKVLNDFLSRSKALRGLLLASSGYIIKEAGDNPELHTESFAVLASNAFNAIDALSKCLQEPDFTVLHQRGGSHQTAIFRVDDSCLLVAVFPAKIPIENIEFAASATVEKLQDHLARARAREPDVEVDLADHNPTDIEPVLFKRKTDS